MSFKLNAPATEVDDLPCRLAVVTADQGDARTIAARLQGCVANRANGFTAHIGGMNGHQVVVAAGEGGVSPTVHVLEAILAAHHPRIVVATGLCTGLAEPVRADAVIVAREVVNEAGKRLVLSAEPWRPTAAVVGSILSLDRPVRTVADKRALARRYQAIGADQESYRLAELCAAEAVPFLSICIATDGPDDEIPGDIRFLLERKSGASKAGALAGTLLRHPSHLKHLWRMKETVWGAGEKMATCILRLAQDLPVGDE